MTTLALAAPAYNEAHGIEQVIESWVAALESMSLDGFEIVIANDGSVDGTGPLLDALAARHPQVRPIHLHPNRGAAAALAAAIRHTTAPWVLLIDSDGQFPIDNLPRLLEAQRHSGARAVHGVRRRKQGSLFARFGSWASGALCNRILGTRYRDFNSALVLAEGPLLRDLGLEARGLNYSTDVMSKLIERGVRLEEVEISHLPRPRGVTTMKALRDASHRFLFVGYVAVRQLLLRLGVLDRKS